uniref:Trimethylguanosine synthase n=1 Tax=Globodera pallida TaxID=36090 RepID=A0A183BTF4_GLOPA
MELDEADGVEQQQDATGLQNQNIFNTMAEAERHASMLLSADGAKLDLSADLIERLCADFDSLDQQQNDEMQGGRAGDEQRQLQLKWALITDTVAQLAAELAESLRAIIEPTIASRLEGDYRTGKRLNMRRLIPYIASDYRKERIWMRRTRKERRNYQICIAVDNSQSMQHNHMTELPAWRQRGKGRPFDLLTDMEPNGVEIFETALEISPNIVYFLPKNTRTEQLMALAGGTGGNVEMEQTMMNEKLKALHAYYGIFVGT